MKKMFIYLLMLSIILGGIMPTLVYAESYDKKMEEVILKVKGLFGISDDYDGFSSQVNSYGNNTNFYFNWTDSTNKLQNISVNTDSAGNVISFNKYDYSKVDQETKLPKYNQEEALKLALDFVKKVDPKLSGEIKLEDNTNSISIWEREYNFRFTRVINNISYTDNNVNISVNKFTGDINNYYTNWERTLTFPKPDNVITLEKAKDAYKDKIGLKLVYKTSSRYPRPLDTSEENSKYYLAYSTIDGSRKGIDAFTGKPINLSYYGAVYARGENEKAMTADSGAPIITPEEKAEIEKLTGIKDVSEIEKKAREILKLGDEYKLEGKNLYSDWNNPGEYQWSLNFIKLVDKNKVPVNIALDAKTGELINFNKYDEINPNDKVTIKKAQALELARDYINKINPDKVNLLEYIEDEQLNDDQQSYYFRFIRKTDDIYVESDGISVGVNAVNKQINSYNLDWYKGKLPPKGAVISLEKAYEVLFSKIGFELGYATIYDYEKIDDNNKEIKLVYTVNQNKPLIINASSGELLDYSGNPYKASNIPVYEDIENSYAKDKINTLAEYGIGFSQEKFAPKDKIKQKDFLYLLWKSINPYRSENESNIDVIYKELINSNIIKDGEANQERISTKEEAVKFVIRAMKYEKIAEIPNIYADIFKDSKDITSNIKGYMTIGYGLKIIAGDGSGLIKPKYELKREDAASIIYNYMFN